MSDKPIFSVRDEAYRVAALARLKGHPDYVATRLLALAAHPGVKISDKLDYIDEVKNLIERLPHGQA